METATCVGLQAVVVSNGGEIVYSSGLGLQDIDTGAEVNDETAFMLASISKTVASTAVMQLVEQGLVNLDDKINEHLSYEVFNPDFPTTDITVKDLLVHTNGINDNWNLLDQYYIDGGDSPIPLGNFLEGYLQPGGEYYGARNWLAWEAGDRFFYSNVGSALLGGMVEDVTGRTFEEYSNTEIFDKLGMTNTDWKLNGGRLDLNNTARPHAFEAPLYRPPIKVQDHYGFPDYPNGQLRTNALSLAKFMIPHMTDGTYDSAQLLEETTVKLMQETEPPLPGNQGAGALPQGLSFYYSNVGGRSSVGHGGAEVGVSTEMWFVPQDGYGVIMLCSGDPFNPLEMRAYDRMINALVDVGRNGGF
jgi:CubicO group peptidase (beta-lactamase class C family)